MSRVGKAQIKLPEKVNVTIKGNVVEVKGPKGVLSLVLVPMVEVNVANGIIELVRKSESNKARSCHGLMRNLLNNMVCGVVDGFSKSLEINGVGYRAEVKGRELNLSLGYSHPVVFSIPQGIEIKVNKQTELTIEGIDRQLVGEVAAQIRRQRPPEPYKGKGIKYAGEVIIRKAGKAAGK